VARLGERKIGQITRGGANEGREGSMEGRQRERIGFEWRMQERGRGKGGVTKGMGGREREGRGEIETWHAVCRTVLP
jgi:hypothetical protein